MDIRRAADHHLVMEAIYGTDTQHPAESKAEASEGNETEKGKEAEDERDLPAVCFHLPRHARTLPTLQ